MFHPVDNDSIIVILGNYSSRFFPLSGGGLMGVKTCTASYPHANLLELCFQGSYPVLPSGEGVSRYHFC